MNHDQFWQIIADECRSDPRSAEEWDQRLINALAELPADEIIEGIWERLKTKAKPLTSGKETYDDTYPSDQQSQEKNLEEEKKEAKKKILM